MTMRNSIRRKEVDQLISKAILFSRVVLISAGLTVLEKAAADDNPRDNGKQWLASMIEAMHALNYQGTVVYLRDDNVETMQVFHAVENGVEQERLVSLNDPMREVIRDADKVTCYFPDTQTIVVDYKPHPASFLVSVPEDLDNEHRRYDINLGIREHVIQRLTQVISIVPIDTLRYARKVWIDIGSRLPLKYAVFDEKGKMVEQMMFTSFSIEDSIPLKSLSAKTNLDIFNWRVRNKENIPAHDHDLVFKEIPVGFRQVMYTRRRMPASKQPVQHILLSDGFASVSVYVDELAKNGSQPRETSLGAINSYSRPYMRHHITVMGEVPAKTVRMIANGIYFQAAERR